MFQQMSFDPAHRYGDRVQRIEYWETLRPWFEEQGYFLFKPMDGTSTKYEYITPTMEYIDAPTITYDEEFSIPEDPFPYAFMGPGKLLDAQRPPYSTTEAVQGQVMYAQDAQGRHVVIKIVQGGSQEYDVLRLLKDQPCLQDPVSFPSVVPILDLLSISGHWFFVMPRWSFNQIRPTFFPTFHLAIQYLISMLEGLAFLHRLRIFHGDIAERNILVNHFSSLTGGWLSRTSYRECLVSNGVVRYAIMDFDLSRILDEETYGSDPRLPIDDALTGFESRPYEAMHAHVDFHPFKYDVACLGIHFAENFQHIIIDVPLLAPLIDRMVTSNIDKRFTASEALSFAQTILPTVSSLGPVEDKLESPVPYYQFDLWAGLPESFISEWGPTHRENIFSWKMRLKNWIWNSYELGRPWFFIYYSRYTLRILTSIPRSMLCRVVAAVRDIY